MMVDLQRLQETNPSLYKKIMNHCIENGIRLEEGTLIDLKKLQDAANLQLNFNELCQVQDCTKKMKEEVKELINMEELNRTNPYLYNKLKEKYGDVKFIDKEEVMEDFNGNQAIQEMLSEVKSVPKIVFKQASGIDEGSINN
jgi:hypothetical protein